MISSFIEDLIRFEMKQMQMQFIASQGGLSGIAKMFMGAVGVGGGAQSINPNSGEFTGSLEFAKGGAFDHTVQAFAKGGTFTNQIVNSPTMFKFAKGTGLMGEAGPEAIMPLKRDNNGNLGVRADGQGGGRVDVVVNNYGTEKAETRETTDSRGNRKIEVIVGDMNAGELSRSGSASQRALGGTYGLRPALIRR
jgi:lambda family phage tail tape measure protein